MLLVVGQDLRPDRDLDHQIVAAGAGAVLPCAALAARRLEMLGVAKVDQGVEALDSFEDDIAALAAVAAVRAAIFDIFLAPESDCAGAAGAGADEDLGLVEEMHGRACRVEEAESEPFRGGRDPLAQARCLRAADGGRS